MKKVLLTVLSGFILLSCDRDTHFEVAQTSETIIGQTYAKKFAITLSKAIAKNSELREILVAEALSEFDGNTDILYHRIKNKVLPNGKSIREILLLHWEEGEESFISFENASPLLNIFATDLEVFSKDLALQNWDISNSDFGVAFSADEDNNTLFVAGDSVASIKKGEIPAIPTFVVNKNERVYVVNQLRSTSGTTDFQYAFVKDIFDGSKKSKIRNQYVPEKESREWVEASELDPLLIKAWEQTKNTILSDQRSLIYYDKEYGRRYSEYLYRFKINPTAYYRFIDGKDESEDPKIKEWENVKTHKRRNAPIEEIVDKIWTKGVFTFVFDIMTSLKSGGSINQQLVVDVKPIDLFIMNPSRDTRKPNLFRRTQYTYRLHADSLQGRWVYPHEINNKNYLRINGYWDLDTQGLSRYVTISEFDTGNETTSTHHFSSEFATSHKITLGFKLSELNLGAESSGTHKETRTSTITIRSTNKSDALGGVYSYFSDPVITNQTSKYSTREMKTLYDLKNISSGGVELTFIPLKK